MDQSAAARPEGTDAERLAAYGEARALIEAAEARAREILEAAARNARSRENEADLLVAKARRVLVAAEQKADVILSLARTAADEIVIDLTDDGDRLGRFASRSGSRLGRPLPTRIDRMLAAAIANAVDEALPVDTSV